MPVLVAQAGLFPVVFVFRCPTSWGALCRGTLMVLPSESTERLVNPVLCWYRLRLASFPVECPAMSRGGLRVRSPFAVVCGGRSENCRFLCGTTVQPSWSVCFVMWSERERMTGSGGRGTSEREGGGGVSLKDAGLEAVGVDGREQSMSDISGSEGEFPRRWGE